MSINLPAPSPEGLKKFITLYKEQMGIDLTEDEALPLATSFLQLYYLGTTPCPTAPPAAEEKTEDPQPAAA